MIACTPAFEMTKVSFDSNRSRSITPTCSATSCRSLDFGSGLSTSRSDGVGDVEGGGGGIILGALFSTVGEKIERTKPSSSSRILGSRDADWTFSSLAMDAPYRRQSTHRTAYCHSVFRAVL